MSQVTVSTHLCNAYVRKVSFYISPAQLVPPAMYVPTRVDHDLQIHWSTHGQNHPHNQSVI